ERTDGTVDHAAGENFTLAGTAFALDEAAGDASAGIGVLAVVDREREEVDSLAGIGIGDRGGEHDVIADANNTGAMRLFGKFAGFEFEIFTTGKFYANFCWFWFHESSFWTGGQGRAWGARAGERMPVEKRGGRKRHFAKIP